MARTADRPAGESDADSVLAGARSGQRPVAVWLTLAARIAVGLIFVLAGVSKLVAPGTFSATLLAYNVLPIDLLRPVSLILPWIEVVVGLYLLAGLFTRAPPGRRSSCWRSSCWPSGRPCCAASRSRTAGCFGSITSAVPALQYVLGGSSLGPADILRDAIYALLALLVALGPQTPFSVDALLAAHRRSG